MMQKRKDSKRKISERPAHKRRGESHKSPGPALNANIWGQHAVRAAWRNPEREIKALYVTENALRDFELSAPVKRPAPTVVEKKELDKITRDGVHQGVALDAAPLAELDLMDLIIKVSDKPRSVFAILDQVTDPHNVGAILRSACALGVDGVIMQKKHAPELTGVLAKTASGAIEHIDVCYETNLSRSIETLKERGFEIIGLDETGNESLQQISAGDKTVIVLGAEGDGLRRLIRENCDRLVHLPTTGEVSSLNVSNAAAIAFFKLCSIS